MKRIMTAFLIGIFLGSAVPCSAAPANSEADRQISFAEHYLKEFEKEVERQKGGQKDRYRYQRDALERVQTLVQSYPDNPKVKEMYARTRTALMKSYGNYMEITPDMLVYKRNEEELRKRYSAISSEAWKKKIEELAPETKVFPTPDPMNVAPTEYFGKYVVLEDVKYPNNQFYGATGEFIHVGKPSSGYYFVDIGGRNWLGPYEAVKRFRRTVDASIGDVFSFAVLGKITGIVMESPDASQDKKAPFVWGWIVVPEFLYLPDKIIAYYDAEKESSGYFEQEEKVKDIKEGWYTVKSVPDDVDPKRLMEIFATAIKEKNYDLYVDCIRPEWREMAVRGNVLYHWDLHQRRFNEQYVAVVFDDPVIQVVKGFDTDDNLQDFFLDDKQRDRLTKMAGEKEERATVYSRAYDENGRQQNPVPHYLVRKGSGRWYVDSYAPRF